MKLMPRCNNCNFISSGSVVIRLLMLALMRMPSFATSKYVHGVLDSALDDWHFTARFCFASDAGSLRYQISYPHAYAVENLLLYYDSPNQWPAVYKSGKTCDEKESVLNREHYQIVNLSTWTTDEWSFPQCVDVQKDNESWFICDRTIKFSSTRERWWFIAISNCNSTKGLYMEYKLWMTNGNPNDFWFYHFSVDEFYILPTDIGFLLLETFALATACAIALVLRSRQMLHVTYKLFLTSQLCECISLLLLCLSYGDYAKTGVGLPLLKLLGEMMTASSTLIFIFMLVLLGKGYTVTRGRLSKRGALKLTLFMTIYTLTYTTLFIHQARYFDPGEVTYLYESPAGYGLMTLRVIGCVWFCYAIYFTLRHYPQKRCFYTVFGIVYSIWFLTGPCIILMANFYLGKWMREKIVNGVEKSLNFIGLIAFLVITRPSAANATFPYHVRTSQVPCWSVPKVPIEFEYIRENTDRHPSMYHGKVRIPVIAAITEDTPSSLPRNTYEMNNQTHDIFTVQRAREEYNAKRRDPFTRRISTNGRIAAANGTISESHDQPSG